MLSSNNSIDKAYPGVAQLIPIPQELVFGVFLIDLIYYLAEYIIKEE
jgi:hypothetical protein